MATRMTFDHQLELRRQVEFLAEDLHRRVTFLTDRPMTHFDDLNEEDRSHFLHWADTALESALRRDGASYATTNHKD